MPPLLQRIKQYEEEMRKWKEAGSPTRSMEEIRRIFNSYCKDCEHLTTYLGATCCDVCGCFLGKTAMINKIYYATSSCPLKIPKWTAELTQEKNKVGGSLEQKEKSPRLDSGLDGCCG